MSQYEIVISQGKYYQVLTQAGQTEAVIQLDDTADAVLEPGLTHEIIVETGQHHEVILDTGRYEIIIEPARGPQGEQGDPGEPVEVKNVKLPCDYPGQPIEEAVNAMTPTLYVDFNDFIIFHHCQIAYIYNGPNDVTLGSGGDYTTVPDDFTVSGVADHDLLSNRDLPDQHPMSAITGLEADQQRQDDAHAAHLADLANPHQVTYEQLGGTQPPPQPHTHVEADITDLDKYTQAEVDASQAAQDARIDANEQAISEKSATFEADTAPPELVDGDIWIETGVFEMTCNATTVQDLGVDSFGYYYTTITDMPYGPHYLAELSFFPDGWTYCTFADENENTPQQIPGLESEIEMQLEEFGPVFTLNWDGYSYSAQLATDIYGYLQANVGTPLTICVMESAN